MTRSLLRALAVLTVAATPVAAQSTYSAAGLGLPVDAVDARARALGNVGIGLMGSSIAPSDPAAATLLTVPGAVFTALPSWVDLGRADTGEAGSYRATRFPLVGVAYPAWGLGMATITFGSVLDQRYEGERSTLVELEDGPVSVTDRFKATGGVSEVRLGLARDLGGGLEVGVSAGRFTGGTRRVLARSLEGVSVEGTVSDFTEERSWDYSGTSLTAGIGVRLGTVGRVAGSVSWSSDLAADADSAGTDRSYAMPLHLRVGGSALLAPGLMVTGSLHRADWSGTTPDLTASVARDVTAYGVGLELTRARLLGRQAPIRLGYRSGGLPFALGAGGEASESAFTGGLGLTLAGTGPVTLAGVDLAVERGERTESGIAEKFWRAALTLRVSGF